MKKLSKLVLGLLVISSASASAFASPIPKEELPSYQEAVNYALGQQPLICNFTPIYYSFGSGNLGDAIQETTSADIDENRAQPLLVFYLSSDSKECSFSVTTSSDYRSVVSVKFVQQTCSNQMVNLGTIESPYMVQQRVCKTETSALCN